MLIEAIEPMRISMLAAGKIRAVLPDGPRFHLGDLVHVHHQDGQVEAGQVEGVTRIEGPSPCKPGYWYWVVSKTMECWIHQSFLSPVPTTVDKEAL